MTEKEEQAREREREREEQARVREEQARERALRDVKMYMAHGWNVQEETPQAFIITRRKSNIAVHLLLFIFTWGVGNIIYYLLGKEKKVIIK